MEERIIKILKLFKSIKPEEGFVNRSRGSVLSAPQSSVRPIGHGIWESLKFGAALALASFLLFVFLGGVSSFNIKNYSPVMLGSVNDEAIHEEAASLDFQIQLGEASYHLDSEKEIGAKIDEIINKLAL